MSFSYSELMTSLACTPSVRLNNTEPRSSTWLKDLKPTFREFPREDWLPLDVTEVGGVTVREATSERFIGARNDFLAPVALSTADLDFGKLRTEEFDTLKKEFGGLSEVGYDPGRDYEAADFLPPLLQALLNQDLEIPQAVTLPESAEYAYPPLDEDMPVDLTANCHGTSWEAMRSYQGHNENAHIYLGEATIIDDALRSETFQPLGEAGKTQPTDLKPGDVVAFDEQSEWHRLSMLLHTATYAGGGLFFAKPNTEGHSEDSPYRLATWEMLTGPVDSYADGLWEARAYRPIEKLKSGSDLFASDQLDEWQEQHGSLDKPVLTVLEPSMGGGIRAMWNTALATVPLSKGQNGRFVLAAEDTKNVV